MENIKFRGKCLHTGKWVYGSLTIFKNQYSKIDSLRCEILEPTGYKHMTNFDPHRDKDKDFKRDWIVYNVNTETVGQYIGRKSISDKEVYLGDKVNIIDSNGEKYNDLTVIWDDEFCGFKAENEDWKLFFFRIEYIEIIGNIHD